MAEPFPRGAELFRWGVLAEKFHALPPNVALLTDAQITQILFHKRDKEGRLVPPEAIPTAPPPKPTKASRLATLAQLEAAKMITPADAARSRAEVEALGED
jgi:hypothetical protein